MTLAAGILYVDGLRSLRHIHVKRSSVLGRFDVAAGMAAEAILVGHALVVKYAAGLVRLVTIDARGQDVSFLLPQLTFDDFAMHLFDLGVTLGTGSRYVSPSYG